MKVIVFVLLAALAVYCTAKPLNEKEAKPGADVWNNGLPMLTLPLKEKEAKPGTDVWNNGLPMLTLNVKGKKVGIGSDISKKAFPGMKGLKTLDGELMNGESSGKKTNEALALQFGQMGKHLQLKTLDGELMKGGSSGKKTNKAFALQFGQMGKHLQQTLDSMVLDQYQKEEREIETDYRFRP